MKVQNTLLEIYPSSVQDNTIKKLLDLHLEALVTFLRPKPHYLNQHEAYGSGFFIQSPDPTVAILMTAKHVLEKFDFEHDLITIGKQLVKLGDIGQHVLPPDRDIAQWFIPSNFLLQKKLNGLFTLPVLSSILANQRFEPLDSFAIFGYPATKNKKFDFQNDSAPDRQIFGLALHTSEYDTSKKIRKFFYKGKGISESWNTTHTTPPHLEGMSGSPCLRIVVEKSSGLLGVILAGVFTDWSERTGKLLVYAFGDPWIEE